MCKIGGVRKETEIEHMKLQQERLKTKTTNHQICTAFVEEYQKIILWNQVMKIKKCFKRYTFVISDPRLSTIEIESIKL